MAGAVAPCRCQNYSCRLCRIGVLGLLATQKTELVTKQGNLKHQPYQHDPAVGHFCVGGWELT